MAPALVEHSSAKERNSISNKYLKFSCMSQLDIDLDLVGKFRHTTVDSPASLLAPNLNKNNKEIIGCQEGMQPNDLDQNPISTVTTTDLSLKLVQTKNGISSKCYDCIKPGIHESQNDNGHGDNLKTEISTASTVSTMSTTLSSSTIISTTEPHVVQPVAESFLRKRISERLAKKSNSVHSRFDDLNQSIDNLSARLKRLQQKNLSSHVACFIARKDQILKETNIKEETDVKSNKCDSKNTSKTLHENKSTDPNMYKELRTLYDLTTNSELTDEDELESNVKIPLKGKKQKSEK